MYWSIDLLKLYFRFHVRLFFVAFLIASAIWHSMFLMAWPFFKIVNKHNDICISRIEFVTFPADETNLTSFGKCEVRCFHCMASVFVSCTKGSSEPSRNLLHSKFIVQNILNACMNILIALSIWFIVNRLSSINTWCARSIFSLVVITAGRQNHESYSRLYLLPS